MPVAKFSSAHELSHGISALHLEADEDQIFRPRMPHNHEEIVNLIRKAKQLEKEEAEANRAIKQVDLALKDASEVLVKAEGSKKALLQANRTLEEKLKDRDERVKTAAEYWKNYGLDVRRLSNAEDTFQKYEFIFEDLSRPVSKNSLGSSSSENELQQSNSNGHQPFEFTPNNKQQVSCSIILKYQDKILELVEQTPEILSSERLSLLNEKLMNQCVNQENGHVNYKSAMTLIRKDLVGSLFPSPRVTQNMNA